MKNEWLVFGISFVLALFCMGEGPLAMRIGGFAGAFAMFALIGIAVLAVARRVRRTAEAA